MAPLFARVTVCGVGLIGGSLAQRARRAGLAGRVIGYGWREQSLRTALELDLVDEVTIDPRQAAAGSQLVVLAVPLRAMPEVVSALAPHLAPGAIVTDVGSVKRWVIEQLEPLIPAHAALVAAHPIAGKETAGPQAAEPDLFVGQRVIITPSARSTPPALAAVISLWQGVGAVVELMEPGLHDQILARASHLPQIVSSALGMALADEKVAGRFAATYGGGGLRDTSRLARSPANVWRDICLTNSPAILEALDLYRSSLARLSEAIAAGDAKRLEELFTAGQAIARHLRGSRRRPVVAIDGPVGAGKSTVARELARELGFEYLNTGAMYRAVALAARRAGLDPHHPDEAALAALLKGLRIEFAGERVLLDGEEVSAALSEPQIGDLASALSTLAGVRVRMRDLQRAAGAGGGVVMEGRDIGTAVFPDAEVKFYLDADVAVRAARRHAELIGKGLALGLEEVQAQLIERDRRDQTRALAPLRCAVDAIVIDSTHLTVAEVVKRLKDAIDRQYSKANGA